MALESPLLEREDETEALQTAIQDVIGTHSGRVVVIEGESGIGKTRLLRGLRSIAGEHGMAVLSARASLLEQSFGFGVVRQLLERAARNWDQADSPAATGAQQVLDPTTAADPHDSGELARLHSLYWLTADTCREPSVLLIDDAQWSDPESLRFLEYVWTRLDDLPVVLAVVGRSGEPGGLPGFFRALEHHPDVLLLRPKPLQTEACRSLLETILVRAVEPEFAQACASVTAGNPLLLTLLAGSVARAGLEPTQRSLTQVERLGSEAFQRQIGHRLDRMSPVVRRVAEAWAALGDDTPTDLVAAVADVDAITMTEAASELAAWGLVEQSPERTGYHGYRHPAAAQAVLDLMPERARQQLRFRCADQLDQHQSGAEQAAAHVLAISPGVDPQAPRRLMRAADSAERRGAPASALTFLTRCLSEVLEPAERRSVAERAGILALQTDLELAATLLQEAVATPPGSTNPQLWAHLGMAYGYLRDPDRAVAAIEHALHLLPDDLDDRRREWEASLLVGALVAPGRRDLAAGLNRVRTIPHGTGIGARLLDAVIALHETAAADPRGAGRAHEALTDGTLVAQANGEGPLVCGWITLVAADDPLALSSLDDAVVQAHEHGSRRALAAALTFRSLARQRAGRPVDAVDDAQAALDHAFSGRVDLDPRFAAGYLAQALLDMGDLDGAERALTSVRGFETADAGPRYYSREAAARLRRLQGHLGDALAIAVDAGRIWAEYGFDNPALGGWRTEAALAAFGGGDPTHAAELAREELSLADSWGAPGARGRARRTLGRVLGGSEGLALLAESVLILQDSPARLEHARSLAATGAALRRTGRRNDAHNVLTEALDLAEICGAVRLTADIAVELRAAGFRPRRHRLGGPESLTISERRVADLAVVGNSNRAIAQALFITTKTVELHLTNTYRKLGIARRSELVDRLTVT